MRAVLVALALVGCVPPVLPAPPPDVGGTCETACANIVALGGCGLETEHCVPDCLDVQRAEAGMTSAGVRFPVGCISAAGSCGGMQKCQ